MARTDFEPLTWEEAEQNRREHLESSWLPLTRGEAGLLGAPPSAAALLAEAPARANGSDRSIKHRSESATEQCERLRAEIKRGREYLEQAERKLTESQAWLEDWPTYERTCGKNPLAHLTQSVLLNARIASFLAAWLKRREAELESLTRSTRS